MGNPVADAGGHDDADQRRDEGHKRQNGFQHRIDGVAPGLEQHRHDGTHPHADFGQQAVALLGDFLAGVIVADRRLGWRGLRGRGGAIFQDENVLFFDAGNVNIFDDILRQRTRFAGRVNINGRDAALRVDTAAQGAAAVDNRHADFRFRRLTLFETIDRLPAGEAGNFIDDRRTGARGDIDNFFTGNGVQFERSAPAAGAFFNANTGHDVAPDRWTFCSSWMAIFFSKIDVVRSVTQPRKKFVTRPTSK